MTVQKKPNHLIHEKSPYLLQHAYNPVNWYPWGAEPFEIAKKENKVVFLSIGYATCHWCHVMERESFEDERTAELLNRYFIAIKLDREERPDLDKIYMDAIHATGQQGGWPLNFFLTPDKMPIFGGTYFPPENRYGRKSFKEIITLVQRSWENHREDMVAAASELTEHLRKLESTQIDDFLPKEDVFLLSFQKYEELYDPNFFGFVFNGPNKFPPSMALEFLIHFSLYFQNQFALEMAYNTVVAMKKGGIYDQIGGGISRYSTDHEWLVPHFEKMLYDNALFLRVVSLLYKCTKHSFFLEWAKEITQYIRRDMLLSEGGVSSAEDADSEGEEGKFYLWSEKEFTEIVQDIEIKQFWNVSKSGNFEGGNILHETIKGTNPYRTISEPNRVWEEKVHLTKQKLLEIRKGRIRPLRDDKIIMSWNCLYIQALIETFEATNINHFLEEAISIFNFLSSKMRREDGTLFRRYREGDARFEGTLCDYAEFILASLKLFRQTENSSYFDLALASLAIVEKHFHTDKGAYYDSMSKNDDLLIRTIDGYDGVEPSGNASMAHIFHFLTGLGVNPEVNYEKAAKIFRYFSNEINSNTTSFPNMLDAYLKWKMKRVEVLILYKEENKSEIGELLSFLRSMNLPQVQWLSLEENLANRLCDQISLAKNRNAGSSHQVYVCHNFMCELPVKGLESLKQLITQLF